MFYELRQTGRQKAHGEWRFPFSAADVAQCPESCDPLASVGAVACLEYGAQRRWRFPDAADGVKQSDAVALCEAPFLLEHTKEDVLAGGKL